MGVNMLPSINSVYFTFTFTAALMSFSLSVSHSVCLSICLSVRWSVFSSVCLTVRRPATCLSTLITLKVKKRPFCLHYSSDISIFADKACLTLQVKHVQFRDCPLRGV